MTYFLRKLAFVSVGAVGGMGLALVTAVVASMLVGLIGQILNPQDPSAGSAAEIMVLLIPLGMIAGAIVGVLIGGRLAIRQQKKEKLGRDERAST